MPTIPKPFEKINFVSNTDDWDVWGHEYPHYFSIVSRNIYAKFRVNTSNGMDAILKY